MGATKFCPTRVLFDCDKTCKYTTKRQSFIFTTSVDETHKVTFDFTVGEIVIVFYNYPLFLLIAKEHH